MTRAALLAVGLSACFIEIAPLDSGTDGGAGAGGEVGAGTHQGAMSACSESCPAGTHGDEICQLETALDCSVIPIDATRTFQGNFCEGGALTDACGEPVLRGYVFEVGCDSGSLAYDVRLTASPAAAFITQLGEACETALSGCSHPGTPPPLGSSFSVGQRVAVAAPADACDEEFIVAFQPNDEP